MQGTPIFDELRRRFGISSTTSADQPGEPENDDPVGEPAVDRDPPGERSSPEKIVVAGGRRVGKTTFVGAASEIEPINTEAWMTAEGTGAHPVDPDSGESMESGEIITVALDFGRLTLCPDLVLSLFGTSEQPESGFSGALGAVVLVDPGRIQESFASIGYFENHTDVPFLVALNVFDGELVHELDDLREALALPPGVPLTTCDVRDHESTARVLRELVSYTRDLSAPDGVLRNGRRSWV
ncbi:MAG: GTP-binding protein [Pseudonocardiaceae bacterium]